MRRMRPMRLLPIRQFDVETMAILAQCLYKPTEEKLSLIARGYLDDPAQICFAYAAEASPTAVCAILGLRLQACREAAIIQHIVVDEAYRGSGLGRLLLEDAAARYAIRSFTAETDQDAVGFYRACGFDIRSLGEKYPGVERFLCEKRIAKET